MNQKELTKTFMMILERKNFGLHELYKKNTALKGLVLSNEHDVRRSRKTSYILIFKRYK